MKYPSRCRRRACQARRTLNKRPSDYKRPPTCHVCGAEMRLDKARAEGKEKHPPECTDTACTFARDYYKPGGGVLRRHRVNNPGCKHYPEWQLERALIASPHCPNKPTRAEEAPF